MRKLKIYIKLNWNTILINFNLFSLNPILVTINVFF